MVIDNTSEIKSDFKSRLRMPKLDALGQFALARRTFEMWLKYSEPKRAVWRMCTAFKDGLQWGVFDRSRHRVLFPDPPSGAVNMVVDKIGPWALDMQAKLSSDQPRPEAFPLRNTADAKDAATAAVRACDHYWDVQGWEQLWGLICAGVLEHGDVFGFEDWDERAGGKVLRQNFTQEGAPDGEPQLVWEGDNTVRIYSAFCVATDMLPTPTDDKFWFLIGEWMSCEDIYNTYKVMLEPETSVTYRDDHYDAVARLVSGTGSMLDRAQMQGIEGCTVYKWYQRPQEGIPEGFYGHFANQKMLRGGAWPVQYAKMKGNPLVKYSWHRNITRYYSQSPIESQIPLQKQINKTESQIIEAKDTMANLKWLVPNGSGVSSITDLSGDFIQYNPPFKPEPTQPTAMPAYVFRHSENMGLHLEDVQLLHKASKGVNPGGSRSGLMLSNLQEQDDRPLSVPERGLQNALSLQFSKKLQIISVMITDDRMIRYVGENNQRQVAQFKGQNLGDHTIVSMRTVPGISKSKTAQAGIIMEAFQIGGIRNKQGQPDSNRFMELMQFAIPGSQYDEANQHREIARQENDLMWEMLQTQEFVVIPAEPWDRHDLHLEEHEQQMNTVRWKVAAATVPGFRQAWEGHWEMTVQAMAQALGATVEPGQQQSQPTEGSTDASGTSEPTS